MALRRGVSVTGLKELRRKLNSIPDMVFKKAIAPVMNREAARILGVAVDNVSVQSGELQRNVQVLRTKLRRRGGEPVDIESGFVFLQIYAAQHHEGMPANGTEFWPGGGQRKYAENAIKDNMDRYVRTLANAIRSVL